MTGKRVVLKNCGLIDPDNIATYLEQDGFKALPKVRETMIPDSVIEEIKASGLRGRGGAGFPCGLKWQLARRSTGADKYVICNADEGEVGTFKDRFILEGDPFSLVEGLAIAGYAVGAKAGYIYLRAEYHHLLDRLRSAIKQAKDGGFLGDFAIHIREGAGAYVCGEESALMDSIEGRRGEVRYRPPFPTDAGLWAQPTTINNVETLMNVPPIIFNGAGWFKEMGTEQSKGTKVFSVSGDVARPGVYELELGSPLRELAEGLAGAADVKMLQIGGATGRIIPYDQIDTPLSFETILGAGAVTVFNRSRDAVDIVLRTLEFLAEESCGKCVPCRQGTQAMVEILSRFRRGEGTEPDIELLGVLSSTMQLTSLCGLGQAAPTPVVDSLNYFREDFQTKLPNRTGG